MAAVRQDSRSGTVSIPAVVAGIIAAADDVLYLILIRSQGTFWDDRGRVIFVATFLAGVVAVTLAAAVANRVKARVALLGAATGALFSLGILAAFSIGLPLLVAGIFTTIAWSRAGGPGQLATGNALAVALALATPGLLIVGIALT